MKRTYKDVTTTGGTNYFFITCRKYSADNKGDKAVKELADHLSSRLMKADDLPKFEKYMKESIELANVYYPSKYELRIEIHPSAFDGNGQRCRSCQIYRYNGGGAIEVCTIYLLLTDGSLSFELESMKKEQPLFPEKGGEL